MPVDSNSQITYPEVAGTLRNLKKQFATSPAPSHVERTLDEFLDSFVTFLKASPAAAAKSVTVEPLPV